MPDAKVVRAFAELPGTSDHHEFQFPWNYGDDKHSGIDKGKKQLHKEIKRTPDEKRLKSKSYDPIVSKASNQSTKIFQVKTSESTQDGSEASSKSNKTYQLFKRGTQIPWKYVSWKIKGESSSDGKEKKQDAFPASEDSSSRSSELSKRADRGKKLTTDSQPGEKLKARNEIMLEKPGKDSDKPGKSLTNSYSKNSSDENESNSSSRKKSLSKKSSKRGAKDEILKISSTHNENLLATLKRFETMFLIDDSVSMARDRHWEMALEVVKSAIEAALPHVPDGIQLQFLNSSQNLVQAKSVDEVMNLLTSFKPNGASTPTETRLEYILNDYLQKIENEKEEKNIISKPLNIIIVTDGVADDLHNLVTTIVKICKRLEAHNFPMSQVGIQFIQIGADRNVTKQLKFLDSKLEDNYGISRDIVDMIEYTGVITEKFNLKCLLGGVNKQIDRMKC